MGRLALAGLLGGIVMFVWSAFSHMVLPLGEMGFSSLPNEDSIVTVLKQGVSQSGMYFFPGMDMSRKMTKEEEDAWTAKYKAGPVGMLIYQPTGEEPMAARYMIVELLSDIVAALFAAWIVGRLVGAYFARVIATAIFGLLAWLSLSVSYWNWYKFPGAYILGEGIDQVVGWFVAGIVIALIVKRPRAQAS